METNESRWFISLPPSLLICEFPEADRLWPVLSCSSSSFEALTIFPSTFCLDLMVVKLSCCCSSQYVSVSPLALLNSPRIILIMNLLNTPQRIYFSMPFTSRWASPLSAMTWNLHSFWWVCSPCLKHPLYGLPTPMCVVSHALSCHKITLDPSLTTPPCWPSQRKVVVQSLWGKKIWLRAVL